MKLLILFPFLLAACHSQGPTNPSTLHPNPAPSAMPSVSPTPLPSPSAAPSDLISVGSISGATDAEVTMIRQGLVKANTAVKSACYRQWVLAARYTETNGMTQAQVLDLQQSQPMSVNIEMYYQNNSTVGFEYDPYDGVVHMNRKFVNTPTMVADNLLHEDRGHGLGFHHYGKLSSSVPYGANYAYEGCSQQQQSRSKRKFKPPGLRIEVRKRVGPMGKPHERKKHVHAS